MTVGSKTTGDPGISTGIPEFDKLIGTNPGGIPKNRISHVWGSPRFNEALVRSLESQPSLKVCVIPEEKDGMEAVRELVKALSSPCDVVVLNNFTHPTFDDISAWSDNLTLLQTALRKRGAALLFLSSATLHSKFWKFYPILRVECSDVQEGVHVRLVKCGCSTSQGYEETFEWDRLERHEVSKSPLSP